MEEEERESRESAEENEQIRGMPKAETSGDLCVVSELG